MIQKYMDLFAERVKRMEVYEDDVWVVTFPKCGTTWIQEMVWLVNNDLNYEKALKENLNVRYPFLEQVSFVIYWKFKTTNGSHTTLD